MSAPKPTMLDSAPFGRIPDEQAQWLTPQIAKHLIDDLHYEGQRRIRQSRVEQLVTEILGGRFRKSVIDIGVLDGKCVLLNGRHRASAVIASGVPIPVEVVYRRGSTAEDLAAEYAVIDNPMVRTHNDNLHAYKLHEEIGVPERVIARASGAAVVIASGFVASAQAHMHMSISSNRAAFVREWARPIVDAFEVLSQPKGGTDAASLWYSHALACVLVTLRYQREAARIFWEKVTENDGLRKGTPEHTLLTTVLNQRPYAERGGIRPTTPARYVRAIATCWNAAYEGRPLSLVKIFDPSSPIKFLGTPYDGRSHRRMYIRDAGDDET